MTGLSELHQGFQHKQTFKTRGIQNYVFNILNDSSQPRAIYPATCFITIKEKYLLNKIPYIFFSFPSLQPCPTLYFHPHLCRRIHVAASSESTLIPLILALPNCHFIPDTNSSRSPVGAPQALPVRKLKSMIADILVSCVPPYPS